MFVVHMHGLAFWRKKGITIINAFQTVPAERLVLRGKNYKYMTSISKKLYIDKLDDIVNKHLLYLSVIRIIPPFSGRIQCHSQIIELDTKGIPKKIGF